MHNPNHYAVLELNRITPFLLVGKNTDQDEYAKITDLGGFSAIRLDGYGATILRLENIDKIDGDNSQVFQLDGNNSIVDVFVVSPDFKFDSEVNLQSAYENAVSLGLAHAGENGAVMGYEEWLLLREYLEPYVKSHLNPIAV